MDLVSKLNEKELEEVVGGVSIDKIKSIALSLGGMVAGLILGGTVVHCASKRSCDKQMESAKNEGINIGKKEAYNEGINVGKKMAYSEMATCEKLAKDMQDVMGRGENGTSECVLWNTAANAMVNDANQVGVDLTMYLVKL